MKLDGLIDSGLKEIGPRLSLIGLLPLLMLFGIIAALLASGALARRRMPPSCSPRPRTRAAARRCCSSPGCWRWRSSSIRCS